MEDLLKELRGRNISITLDKLDLKIKFNGTELPGGIIQKIKENKEIIVQYLITLNKNSVSADIAPAEKSEHYPLSSSQRRLWVLSQVEEGNIAHNIHGVYFFEGNLNRKSLAYSFETLIERHESLRTVFRENAQGEVRQFIQSLQAPGFNIGYRDLRNEQAQEEQVRNLIQQEVLKPFDLAVGPLLRINLYQVSENKCVFSYVIHHIISDSWSLEILIRELLLLYNAHRRGKPGSLTPLRIQYKDYAVWQQKQLSGESLKAHKSYWLKQFEGELPVLELHGDKPRPFVKTYNGESEHRRIDDKLCKKIKALCQEQGGTLFMGLLAAVNVLLYYHTNQEDIIIGSPIAGREHIDLEDQIGFYVNTVALRTRFKKENSFSELLESVKQVTLDAYEHQVYPFDELINELQLKRDRARNVLFDVWVVLDSPMITNKPVTDKNLGELKISAYQGKGKFFSKFDLLFGFVEVAGHLHLNVLYNTDILSKRYADDLIAQFENILYHVVKDPAVKLFEMKEHFSKIEQDILKEHVKNIRLKNLNNLRNKS